MYCPNCGSDNSPDGKFCRRCGTGLAAVSAALQQKPVDSSALQPKLAQLIKGYHSGQDQTLFGGRSVALGAVATVFLMVTGLWGFFWIFFSVFMGLFGNGVHQFRRGWNRWSEAGSEPKALGNEKRPSDLAPKAEFGSFPAGESRQTTSLPTRFDEAGPPSVTESTTRHLKTHNGSEGVSH